MKNNIFNILKKELREIIRDKKSLMMMFIMPFMVPLFAIGMSFFYSTMDKPVEDYNKIGISYTTTEAEKTILEELKIEPVYDTYENLKEKYEAGELNLYISKEENIYTLHGEYNENTELAKELANSYLEVYKAYLQSEYLIEYDINPIEVIEIIGHKEDIVVKENPFVKMITQECFLFVITALTISAIYAATDSIAGEKEKGTLETLLTFPVKARDIILGKFLGISISAIVAGLFSILLMVISLSYSNGAFEIYKDMNIVPNMTTIIYAIFIVLIYSFFVSGLCIAIASKTKTYKEAQSALTPLSFVAMFPGLIATMISIKTTALLSMVPFLNISLLFNDIIVGKFSVLNLFLVFISSLIFIGIVLTIIIKQYKSEKVLFSN